MCAAQKKTLKGEAGFDAYYGQLFKECWSSLRSALLKNARYVSIPAKVGGAKDYFLDAASVSAVKRSRHFHQNADATERIDRYDQRHFCTVTNDADADRL